MKMPMISIIIPIYNGEKYLEKCLDSIIGQDYNNLQIILVNDGSTDKSGNICKAYAEKDSRIIYTEQPNGGISNARNAGKRMATGDYFYFMDCDDFLENNAFSELIKAASDSCGMVFFEYSIDTNENIRIHSLPDEFYGELRGEAAIRLLMKNPFIWDKLIPRSIAEDVFFDEDVYRVEDTPYALKCLIKCDSVRSVKKPYYHYVQSEGSVCRSKFNRRQLSGLCAYDEMFSIIKENYPSLMNLFYSRCMNFCLVMYGEIKDSRCGDTESLEKVREKLLNIYKKTDKSALSKKERLKLRIFKICPSAYMLLRRFS